jgi:hypothetical protein
MTGHASITSWAFTARWRPRDGGAPFFTRTAEQRTLGEHVLAILREPGVRSSLKISARFPISCALAARLEAPLSCVLVEIAMP